MQIIATPVEYEALSRQWVGKRVALVPTMGALHAGHQSLIRKARQIADIVVVSIFVNPMQFGPQEDFTRYPRPLDADLAVCRELGVHAVFHPEPATMYPNPLETSTKVIPPVALTEQLCGEHRPGHFTGVATVVLMLFNIIRPHLAVFGEKDAQQLFVIQRMVRDLHVPVEIVSSPTVRETDGLAMSSRNVYLKTPQARQAALALVRILQLIRKKTLESRKPLPARKTLDETAQALLVSMGETGALVNVQYLEAFDKQHFAPADTLTAGVKVLIAAYVGDVRLIDNLDI